MLEMQIQPRFQETDALGHINNTVPAVWFESARDPLFRIFSPELDVHDWHLIIAGYTVQFKRELFYGSRSPSRPVCAALAAAPSPSGRKPGSRGSWPSLARRP